MSSNKFRSRPKQFKTDQVKKYYAILCDFEDWCNRHNECLICGREAAWKEVEIHESGFSELVGKPPQKESQLKITHEKGCRGQQYLKDLKRIRKTYGV